MKPAWDKLVLLAGHPRGGTTWLGAVLSAAAEAHYIFEPQLVANHPPTTFGDKVEEYHQLPRWYLSAADDLGEYRQAFIGHLRELVRAYFDRDHVPTLAIKLPETERLPWLLENLSVDRLVYIQRHPLGILNSYDRSRVYWAVRQKWDPMVRDVAERFPQLQPVVAAAGSGDLEKTVATIHVRYRLLRDVILADAEVSARSRVVDYERLAADPVAEYAKIYSWLGWRWTDRVAEKTRPYFHPQKEQQGFFEVEKTSEKRIYAWRRELAPWQIRRTADFYGSVGADYPVPGAGFPDLTAGEQIAAVLSFVNRRARRAYRRVESLIRG